MPATLAIRLISLFTIGVLTVVVVGPITWALVTSLKTETNVITFPPTLLPSPATLASYVASTTVDIYLEHPSLGDSLVNMPLFLAPAEFVYVPLEPTYQEAFRAMPRKYRDVLSAGS